ncbi:hypothetical protein AAG906_011849 [Vitis piasezkii]
MSSTSEGQFAQPAIPRFDGHYDHWSMLMENFLRSKEYWSLVETGYDEPQANATILRRTRRNKWDSMKKKYEGIFHGEQMREVTIVEKILRSLTDNFNYIVCSIEESKDTDTLTIDELQSSLIVHEQKFHKNRHGGMLLSSTGHFQYDCPTWNKEANYAELEEHEDVLLMAYVEEHEAMRNDVWFLDSGCSNHMCGDARMFSELDESFSK